MVSLGRKHHLFIPEFETYLREVLALYFFLRKWKQPAAKNTLVAWYALIISSGKYPTYNSRYIKRYSRDISFSI